jgi:UDP-3-O-[3-hydroxymyristoyl] glucosamine N-acyltransferase
MSYLIDLIALGAGNPDIVRLIEDINENKKTFNFLGFLEKNEELKGKSILGYPILGVDDLLFTEFKNCSVVNNIFNNAILHEKITCILKSKYKIKNFPNLVHPAVNTKFINMGEGNLIYENVSLGVNSGMGNFNLIFYGSVIGHETQLKDFNLLGANVSIGARCHVGNKCIFANGATLNGNITLCDDVFVGLGSVVVNSVKEPQKLFGNPAKVWRL